jgi:hypothetical protein
MLDVSRFHSLLTRYLKKEDTIALKLNNQSPTPLHPSPFLPLSLSLPMM